MNLSNVKTLGQWVFHSCSKLTSVTLPSSLTYIRQCTFYGCSSLSSITIPSSVEYIGAGAFSRCTSLTSITIPSSVKEIGDEAFIFTKLTNISIPTSVTYIGNDAFGDTPWFTNQPDGLIYLGSNAYKYKGTMAANTNLTLNSGTTSISSYAFYNCSGLLTITIPSTVTAIGNNAFKGCSSLTTATFQSTQPLLRCPFDQASNPALTKIIVPNEAVSTYQTQWQYNGLYSGVTISPTTIDVTSISLSSTSVTLTPNSTKQLTCTILPSDATNKTITWSTSNSTVATVSTSGLVTAKANGTATITAKSANGKTATCSITVSNPVTTIALNKTSETLWNGGTVTLSVTYTPTNADNRTATWTSSNTSVATVSTTGVVTAKGKGTATITAKSANGKTATCSITVKQQVTGITLSKTSVATSKGNTVTLTATTTPSTANTTSVTWSSSDTNVATVSTSGVITAIAPGTATITCTASDGYGTKATCAVTVGAPSNVQIVDLGLPSCTQWASINIGASSENAYGNYYAWGETNVKSTYSKVNYTLASGMTTEDQWGSTKMTKYTATDGKKTLEASDDAAIANWGSAWETPTTTQYQELIDNCTWTIENGAYRVTGPNGKSILLPFAGCRYDGNGYSGTHSATTDGYYMAKSVNTSNYGNGDILSIATKNNYKSVSNFSRFYGISVRPVSTTKATHTKVTAITISGTASIFVGKTTTLTATITPTNATDKRVAWKSSNTAVATVNENGVVTGVAKGTATITATAKDGSGISKTYSITVKQQVTSISLNKTTLALTKGATSTLTATVTPSTASNTGVTWSSSNTTVATVSTAGVVTAVANGSATITCTASDGYGTKTTCNVTVTNPVTSISLNATSATLKVNETKTLTVTYNPTDADNQSVTWSSSNTSVATVSTSGLVTAKGKGTATITCTSTDNSTIKATCAITVKQQVTSVTLSKTALNIVAGKTATLTATAAPSTANNTAVNWSSSNTKVATVSGGTITAVAAGTATITATAADGYGTKSTCTVTVIARGDVDGSGTIDNADITADVKFVMGDTDVTGLYADAADYNNNGKVTSTDAIAIVRLALTQTTTISGAKAKGMNANTTSKLLAVDDINMVSGEAKEISIRLADNMDKFTNIMFDVALPEGITIENVSVGSRTTDHSAVYSLREDGTVRVICYSLSNDLFTASDGDIVKLKLKADSGVFDGTYDIDFTNIKLVRKDVSSVTSNYETTNLNIGNTTGIGSVNVGDGKISASFKNGTLTITANEDGMASIYAVSGALVYKNKLKAGEKVTISVPRGVYIINGTKTSIK